METKQDQTEPDHIPLRITVFLTISLDILTYCVKNLTISLNDLSEKYKRQKKLCLLWLKSLYVQADETLSGIILLSQITQFAYQLGNISIACFAFGRSNEKYKPRRFHHNFFSNK